MKKILLFYTAVLLALTFVVGVSAQQSDYNLWKDAIYAGGETATGGGYQLQSTVGQPNVEVLQGGSYQLTSGFWHPVKANNVAYLPIIQR